MCLLFSHICICSYLLVKLHILQWQTGSKWLKICPTLLSESVLYEDISTWSFCTVTYRILDHCSVSCYNHFVDSCCFLAWFSFFVPFTWLNWLRFLWLCNTLYLFCVVGVIVSPPSGGLTHHSLQLEEGCCPVFSSGFRIYRVVLCPGLKSVWELKQSLLIVDDVQVIDVRSHFHAVLLGQHVSHVICPTLPDNPHCVCNHV